MSYNSNGSATLVGGLDGDPYPDGAMATKPQSSSDNEVPSEYRDNKSLYYSMMLFGIGMLTTWNIILNSIDHFQSLYTGKQSENISFYLTLAFSYPGLPILLSMIKFGDKLSTFHTVSGCFLFQALSMIILPFASEAHFWVCMIMAFIMGLTNSLLQSKLFAFSSIFPPHMSRSLMSGQGLAGVTASVTQIIVKIATSKYVDEDGNVPQRITKKAAIAYFVFAALLLACCGLLFISLYRTPFVQYYVKRSTTSEEADDEQTIGLLEESDSQLLEKKNEVSVKSVLWKCKGGVFSLALVYIITFLMFPGVTLSVPYKETFGSAFQWLGKNGWWPIILIFIFNIFDTVGRSLAGKMSFIKYEWLPTSVLLRGLLIIIFFGAKNEWSSFFGDATYLLLNVIFAFTNGLFTSLSFVYTPERCESHEKSTAGATLSFTLSAAIMTGSSVALTFT